jgi:general secretion pathway protein D
LIEKLDATGRTGGNFFIIYLKNADANTVAQTLQGLLTGNSINTSQAQPTIATPNNSISTNAQTSLAGASENTVLPFSAPAANNVSFSANGVTVQADIATNSLVVMAPEPVYNTIRGIVEKLDVQRAQVFIEALIVEVNADKAAEFGIQWQVLSDPSKSGVHAIGGTNFGSRGTGGNIIDASMNITSVGRGLNLGIIDGTVSLGGATLLNLGAMARALEQQTKANILSTPTLLTLDNQEASIMVGQNISVPGAVVLGTAGSQNQISYDRKDVGLMLKIKPQILESGVVRMNIYQEVSRVENWMGAGNNATPILSKRALDSSVVVDDNQIIVLGGLIEDRMSDEISKVPLLGDIPLLGRLFRYDSRSRNKTNLMIFLKPTIIRAGADAVAYTTERYRYLMGEQQRLGPRGRFFWTDPTIPEVLPQGLLPGSDVPLPPIPRGQALPSGSMLIPLTPFVPER